MISADVYREVQRLEIETNRLINSYFAGEYLSAFKGRGVEFESVRPYVEGDEIRFIDWNVSAKLNQLYVKQYQEERELSIVLTVDVSGSMFFGSGLYTKRELVTRLAALLGLVALKNNDRVGLILFDEKVRKVIMPRKGRKHTLTLIRELLMYEPQRTMTNIREPLELINRMLKKKSVVILLSDFIGTGQEQALDITARKHDFVPIVITDPLEEKISGSVFVRLEDLETGAQKIVYTGDPAVQGYLREQKRRRTALTTDFRKRSLEPLFLSTNEPYLPKLMRYFKKRTGRRER
jgi:uncharacterized protein (DUF58 family)